MTPSYGSTASPLRYPAGVFSGRCLYSQSIMLQNQVRYDKYSYSWAAPLPLPVTMVILRFNSGSDHVGLAHLLHQNYPNKPVTAVPSAISNHSNMPVYSTYSLCGAINAVSSPEAAWRRTIHGHPGLPSETCSTALSHERVGFEMCQLEGEKMYAMLTGTRSKLKEIYTSWCILFRRSEYPSATIDEP